MRVLVVKTSSLGDIIHTLPALTDAKNRYPNIQFDWVVEESFKEIPAWHKAVERVIPIAFRRWRKGLSAFNKAYYREFFDFIRLLRLSSYDCIIDAQGLLKSAFVSLLCKGERRGLSWQSAREPFASLFYHQRAKVSWQDHAVTRARALFALSLHYSLPNDMPDYGIEYSRLALLESQEPYFVFLHGTTWETKHWPEEHWIALAKLATDAGFKIRVLWGNETERLRAERMHARVPNVQVMPKQSLKDIAGLLASAKGIVTVDTGLGHLAAALDVPTISLYGPTDPKLNGTLGRKQYPMDLAASFSCSPCKSRVCRYDKKEDPLNNPPCLGSLTPDKVWQKLLLQTKEGVT